jgi:hypothetical protein
MMALWMLYAAVLSALVTLAAWGAEQALRLNGRPARWVWASALAASLMVPATVGVRPPLHGGEIAAGSPAGGADGARSEALGRLTALRPTPSPALERATPYLLGAWALATAGGLVFFGVGLRHLSHRRRRWPRENVRGGTVRISERFGPAVVGVLRPEIVLPRWMLGMNADALDLALRHEREHLERKDTLLLAAAFLATVASPWNVALWAQLWRLRLAVELDCDLRVLEGGASRKRYGALLLHVGGQAGRGRLGVAALSEPTSFLERRLRMITRRSDRKQVLRTLGALALTGAGVAGACDVPAPTAVAAPPSPSAQMETIQSSVASGATLRVRGAGSIEAAGAPVIFVDGIRLMGEARDALSELEPTDILRIEVIQGAEAGLRYPDTPEAANGVIRIYMKPGRGGA